MANVKSLILIFSLLLLLTVMAAGKAKSEDQVDIPLRDTAIEKASLVPSPSVSFSLTGSDIIGWEESGEGKFIYLNITDEKNEELAKITQAHLGEPMLLNLDDNFILIPEITKTLNQKNGFVIYQEEAQRRKELIHMMLGWPKQQNAPVKKKKKAALEIEKTNSGPADSVP